MIAFVSDRPSLRLEAFNALPFSFPRHMLKAHNNKEAMPRGITKPLYSRPRMYYDKKKENATFKRSNPRTCRRHQYRHDQAFGDDLTTWPIPL